MGMNTNGSGFKNVYPVKKPNRANKANRFTLINIGQILLICFLFIIITVQVSGLMSGFADLTKKLTDDFGFSSNKSNNSFEDSNDSNQNPGINPNQSAGEANNGSGENINDNSGQNINNNSNDSEILFILGENNGKLAVLSPDGQTVYETYDVYINTLPDYDKNLLLNGIKIKTAEDLRSLLEDYSS